jgi:1,4-dihydroxy-2-naphthoate octaprenyltransferase
MQPSILWRATRAYSLPASVVPVLLGTVLAARGYATNGSGHFNAPVFLFVLLGAILAHFGANVLNDYFDYMKGVDTKPEHGSGVLTGGQMTAPQALGFGLCLMLGAGVCGLLLLGSHSSVVLPLALLGLGCAVLYPIILKQYALGDLLIIVAFGLGLTIGAFAVQVERLSLRQLLLVGFYSIPVCFLVDAILHANNLRDASDDRAAGVRTLATLLPPRAGELLQAFLLFGPIAFVFVGIAIRLLPIWSLITILSIPLLVRAYRSGNVPETAQTHLVFGLLYALSFLP